MWNKLYAMLCWPLTWFNLTLWPEELEIDQWKYHCKICQRVQLHRVMKKTENIEWIYKSLHRGKVKVESSRTLMDNIVYNISDWCTYRNNDINLRIQWWTYEWYFFISVPYFVQKMLFLFCFWQIYCVLIFKKKKKNLITKV